MAIHEKVLILASAGKDGQLVARKVRANNVYSEVNPYSYKDMGGWKCIILTGKGEFAGADVPVLDLRGKEPDSNAIKDFLVNTAKCSGDFTIEGFVNDTIEEYKTIIGDKKVLLALSGGVDSSVCAALVSKAIGKNLTCVFVDTGLMRKNEGAYVKRVFTEVFNVDLIYIDAEKRFLDKLAGVTDPERKRKIIGEEFIRVFEEEATKIGAVPFFMQGTIYPDVIESGLDGAASVKSHHNVGGLPEHIKFEKLLEPLRFLFNDEVRRAGVALGLPDELAYRQPFPGPGLAVRCMGALTKERLDTLRDADYIFRTEVDNAGLGREISQYFAILTLEKSVGVDANSARTYGNAIALRAIKTIDFMTAEVYELPYALLHKVVKRITSEVKGINRVFYDITPKAPATVEWE